MAVKKIPDGCDKVIPHLVVDGAAKALEFYKKAFNAQELSRSPGPDGKRLMHASMLINGSLIFLCDDFPEFCGGKSRNPKALGASPCTISFYVEDTDAWVDRAAKAGAEVTMPAADMFWGDRYGTVRDPFGHDWAFATHIKDMTPDDMAKAMQEMCAGQPG
ncbi:MAG: VOC family protein [Phycisphaerales bacterium]|nr:VOC family protein [Phycisphaerales bacterium]